MPFVPLDPEIMGRGGSFVADAHGYESFFYNPAGFSRGTGSFSLSSSMWIHARPDQFLNLVVGSKTQTDILTFLNEQVTTGGFGMGASTGIGYVGNGLGLGFVMMADSMMYGPSLLGLTGDLTRKPDYRRALRPHRRGALQDPRRGRRAADDPHAHAAVQQRCHCRDNGTVLGREPLRGPEPRCHGYGVGFALDFGAIAELGWFTVGLSIRDLGGTQFTYNQNSFGTWS